MTLFPTCTCLKMGGPMQKPCPVHYAQALRPTRSPEDVLIHGVKVPETSPVVAEPPTDSFEKVIEEMLADQKVIMHVRLHAARLTALWEKERERADRHEEAMNVENMRLRDVMREEANWLEGFANRLRREADKGGT